MVLVAAPKVAAVWGFCPDGGTGNSGGGVDVRLDGGAAIRAEVVMQADGNWTWAALLPATRASFTNHTVTATTTATTTANITATSTITVLFGDVWVCSGQSDMETDIGGVNNSAAEEASMAGLHGIRLFHVGKRAASTPQLEVIDGAVPEKGGDAPEHGRFLGWTEPCPRNGSGVPICRAGFSGDCWLFGRDLYKSLRPPRPLGLIEVAYGGTPIVTWSTPESLAACNVTHNETYPMANPFNISNSGLFNGMIYPLLNSSITGIVWYVHLFLSESAGLHVHLIYVYLQCLSRILRYEYILDQCRTNLN
jgi:sialate O-acetylesterase